jgi:hypothetical protein
LRSTNNGGVEELGLRDDIGGKKGGVVTTIQGINSKPSHSDLEGGVTSPTYGRPRKGSASTFKSKHGWYGSETRLDDDSSEEFHPLPVPTSNWTIRKTMVVETSNAT